jgi:hypothetical protein
MLFQGTSCDNSNNLDNVSTNVTNPNNSSQDDCTLIKINDFESYNKIMFKTWTTTLGRGYSLDVNKIFYYLYYM